MKNIQLTDKHREMLLEMCEKLFLETPYLNFYKNWDKDKLSISNYKIGEEYNENKKQIIFDFHWYEFVHTELVEKILNPTPDKPCRNISGKFKDFFWESNCYWSEQNKETALDDDEAITYLHPIEYLYKIFKQTN